MSSMWRVAAIFPVLLAIAPSSSAQAPASYVPAYAAVRHQASLTRSMTGARLRQSSNYSFADYARFLIANPGWPDGAKMRRWAEKAMQPWREFGDRHRLLRDRQADSGNGWARLADAYASSGRTAEALAAREAPGRRPTSAATDEQAIWARYGASFTRADHDRRVDALLFAKKADDAARFLPMASPQRQAAFGARIAMQRNAADAESRYQSVIGTRHQRRRADDGPRALPARPTITTLGAAARRARPQVHLSPRRSRALLRHAADLLANDAAQDATGRPPTTSPARSTTCFRPAPSRRSAARDPRRLHDARLARRKHRARPHAAPGERGRDVRPLCPRRPLAAGPDQGLLLGRAGGAGRGPVRRRQRLFPAGRGLSRAVLRPARARAARPVGARRPPHCAVSRATPAQRTAFNSRRLVQAVRMLTGQLDRAGIVREARWRNRSTTTPIATSRSSLASSSAARTLPVWIARMARIKGSMFYVRQAYPSLPAAVSSNLWSLAHGISRQESSFDPYAISHAGARGMMQLMTGTAREQAGKMGVAYDGYRLISDPSTTSCSARPTSSAC